MAPAPRRMASSTFAPASAANGSSRRSTSRPDRVAEVLEIGRFVTQPAFAQNLDRRVLEARRLDLALDAEVLEVAQVAAAQMVREVSGGEEDLGVG